MKIRTFKYIFKEGFVNSYRNKLMSFASISIITASILIFGIFFVLVQNMNYNATILKQQPQVQVFCNASLDDAGVAQIQQYLATSPLVREYKIVTKSEAFAKLKELLGNSKDLLEGIDDDSFLSVSFIVNLNDPAKSNEFSAIMEKVTGVDNVKFVQETLDVIARISNWVQVASIVIMIFLLIVSVFIIANTIKLALFARRREISIMKYIGATDWFIRWPFIVEGVIIGVIGAILAFAITGYGYDILVRHYGSDPMLTINSMLKLLKLNDLWTGMIGWFLLIGAFVGASGSYLSIRRYLRV